MSVTLTVVIIGTFQLDKVFAARADLSALPMSTPTRRRPGSSSSTGFWADAIERRDWAMAWVREKLDRWTSNYDDKYVSWLLGIGWSCCGGGLAGACLVVSIASYMSPDPPDLSYYLRSLPK